MSKENFKVISEIENGWGGSDMCQEFGLINSTIQKNCKNRTKINSAIKRNGSRTN